HFVESGGTDGVGAARSIGPGDVEGAGGAFANNIAVGEVLDASDIQTGLAGRGRGEINIRSRAECLTRSGRGDGNSWQAGSTLASFRRTETGRGESAAGGENDFIHKRAILTAGNGESTRPGCGDVDGEWIRTVLRVR